MPLALTARGIRGELYRKLEQAPASQLDPIASIIDSDALDEEHAFLGEVGKMREWIGGRQVQELSDASFKIINRKYENTLLVKSEDILYDRTSQVQKRIDEMIDGAVTHRRDLLMWLANNAASGVAYNGNYFFANNHVFKNSGPLSNLITFSLASHATGIPTDERGSATDPSPQTMSKAMLRGIKNLYAMKDDTGEELVNRNMREVTILTGLDYWEAAKAAVKAISFAGGADNTLPVVAEDLQINLRVVPDYTPAQSLDVYRSDGNFKALVIQETDEEEVQVWDEESDFYKDNDAMKFGLKVRRGRGYGEPRSATRVTLAA